MSFSIIVPSRLREEQQITVQDRVAAMSMEELESQVFEDSMMLGYLTEFGQKCQAEIDYRGSVHRQKINQNSTFGALSSSKSEYWNEWKAKQTIPIVRKVVPGLIASELVGVQPMAGFSSLPAFRIKTETSTSMGRLSATAGINPMEVDVLLGSFASAEMMRTKNMYYYDTESTWSESTLTDHLDHEWFKSHEQQAAADVTGLDAYVTACNTAMDSYNARVSNLKISQLADIDAKAKILSDLKIFAERAHMSSYTDISKSRLQDVLIDVKPSAPDGSTLIWDVSKPKVRIADSNSIIWMNHDI